MCYAASHQWQAFVKQYGTIAAFKQDRVLGSKTAVGVLVALLSPGIISTQDYARTAFCTGKELALEPYNAPGTHDGKA